MLKNLGKFGISAKRDFWYAQHPDIFTDKNLSNWLFLPIVENSDKDILSQLSEWCITQKFSYACCVGQQAEILHDLIDEAFVMREMQITKGGIPEVLPLTSWHIDIEECIYFATCTANHPDVSIENIFCLDITNQNEQRIMALLKKIALGWIPNSLKPRNKPKELN